MTNITDEQRKEALGWAEKIYSFCGDCYNCPHLDEGCESARNTIRSALEPKVVTREWFYKWSDVLWDGSDLIASMRDMFNDLGIIIKEEKQ